MKNIPNFDPLFDEVVAYVREHQGEKGYIDTQDPSLDTIYTFNIDEIGDAYECKVHGVRVMDYGDEGYDLEVIAEPVMRTYETVYSDEDFRTSEEWESVRWSEMPYIHTLLSIAESIEEYA